MNRRSWASPTLLAGLSGALAAVASAAGVFLRGDLATAPYATFRGDTVQVLINGIYRFNGENVGAEGIGWDLVTLFLVVPALALALPSLRRGSLRARLATMGILAYFGYQYAEYAMALAYGPLFLLYVAIVGLSLSAIAVVAATLDGEVVRASVGRSFPHRPMVGFGLYMAGLLAMLWLPLIVRTLGSTSVAELYGGTTLVVQAFDLGLLVPLGLFTAVTVHRRMVAGYVLSAIVVVKGVALGIGIAAMLVVEYLATDVLQPVPIALFLATAAASGVLAVRVLRSIQPPSALLAIRISEAGLSATVRPTIS